MTQKHYDKEFKLNAVRLYLANKGSKSIRDIAGDLGVSRTSLGQWIIDYRNKGEGCFVGSGHLFHSSRQRYEFMKQHNNYFCIDQMAKTLGVGRSGYYSFIG
jgi:transposase-like protein